MRTYLAIRNGVDAPLYLGSRATFALGEFGGHAAGALTHRRRAAHCRTGPIAPPMAACRRIARPRRTNGDRRLYGPHGAPDFFRDDDIDELLSRRSYEVHYNSARTGVRLIGPKPHWARADGGEAGLHPSNIHDNAYAIGAIDFTGDMPIILAPDGPSLGGFVCPAGHRRAVISGRSASCARRQDTASAPTPQERRRLARPSLPRERGERDASSRRGGRRPRSPIAPRATAICSSNMVR